ncbi:uncharacterized protein VTP21DRAFT_2002 [Calcarisporiella thermophila]|uniref:uncharacterized protein n=1 Tax=Calcarisporiella thermophila TaxID=911321 RepID=UPI0037435046
MRKTAKTLKSSRQIIKENISGPITVQHQDQLTVPKKVIRALYDHRATRPGELSFSKGDFFYVFGKEEDSQFFEACNPVKNLRGLVPVSLFQVLDRNERSVSTGKDDSGANFYKADSGSFVEDTSDKGKKMPSLYGIVLYDFKAERPDELDARAGEHIIVIAQSNLEWFVAKPITRLGGPGLIPVSFVEIRDPATGRNIQNIQDLLQNSNIVPRVEEWKKMAQGYEESSIPLGRLDFELGAPQSPQLQETFGHGRPHSPAKRTPSPSPGKPPYSLIRSPYEDYEGREDRLQPPKSPRRVSGSRSRRSWHIVRASVKAYYREDEHWWFEIHVYLSDGRYRVLHRVYEDFYLFQTRLLKEFPVEAGRTGEERILPFMPGPVETVSDSVTAQRRVDLDVYLGELCQLPPYILEHPLIDEFFGMRQRDIERRLSEDGQMSETRWGKSALGTAPNANATFDPRPAFLPRPNASPVNSPRLDPGFGDRSLGYREPPLMAVSGSPKPVPSSLRSSPPRSAGTPPVFSPTLATTPGSSTRVSPTPTSPAPADTGLSIGSGARLGASTLKVKIIHQDEIYVIKVPDNVAYRELYDKTKDLLGAGFQGRLQVREIASGDIQTLENDEDLDLAIKSASGKLVIQAE